MTAISLSERATIVLDTLDELYPEVPPVPLNYTTDWELLVAVILSAQCTDVKVNEVTGKLFRKYSTLTDYVQADQEEFEHVIRSTGFYRN